MIKNIFTGSDGWIVMNPRSIHERVQRCAESGHVHGQQQYHAEYIYGLLQVGKISVACVCDDGYEYQSDHEGYRLYDNFPGEEGLVSAADACYRSDARSREGDRCDKHETVAVSE